MNRRIRGGLVLVGTLVAAAALAPVISRYHPADPTDLTYAARNLPPSIAHPFGTDHLSRDLLSRVLHGLRFSLSIALAAVALSLTVGTLVGLVAGYARRAVDDLLMRWVDAGLAMPRVFLVLVVLALWERVGVTTLVLILGLTSWLETSRLVRAEVRSVRQRPYVAAARSLGLRTPRLLFRHVLPNVATPILVTGALSVGTMVLLEAGLSYLGIGVPPPAPSLGSLINDGRSIFLQAPWISLIPGLVIVFTVLGFNLLADGLQSALDPHSR